MEAGGGHWCSNEIFETRIHNPVKISKKEYNTYNSLSSGLIQSIEKMMVQ